MIDSIDKEHPTTPDSPGWFRKFYRWTVIILLSLIGLMAVLQVAIRIPAVQAFGVQKIGQSLSGTLGVPVSVGSFYYDFKSKLIIHDVFVPDFHGDTILYAGDIQLQLRSGLLALRNSQLALNDLMVCDVLVKDTRYPDEEISDLSRLLRTSGKKDTLQEDKKPFDLS